MQFELSGRAEGSGSVKTKVGKLRLDIKTDEVDAETTMSGVYQLTLVGEEWRIRCD